ncbi:hypothetical protein HBI24_095110 [Parastagonospora nodorum]|nr:hypothetical protein HBH52_102230 [Parastagonospora nodorum]KAH4222497.1 hypothetical protein HBI06_148750 [Parastagonospora nodorum]KAH4228503.1 hypothetical protein HBI05_206180 [Parastagonospora nodorum]KAH4266095.1 hypothetical protein HBI03_078780 [Parastagonospora nodorum]KAH4275773.1 hypothetical protein HBI04_125960 [Parastagonospora nodorum]
MWDECFKHGSDNCDATKSGPFVHNLLTTVHPIYHSRNWILEDFPLPQNNTWSLVEPALHIATKLITTVPALAFFRHVKYGHLTRQNDQKSLCYTAPEDTVSQDLAVLADLHKLSKRIRILFAALKPEARHTSQTRAIHHVSQASFSTELFIKGDRSALPARHDKRVQYIVVNEAYAANAEYTNPSPAQAARFAFGLAATRVHETAHAFYARDFSDGREGYEEPFLNVTHFNNG